MDWAEERILLPRSVMALEGTARTDCCNAELEDKATKGLHVPHNLRKLLIWGDRNSCPSEKRGRQHHGLSFYARGPPLNRCDDGLRPPTGCVRGSGLTVALCDLRSMISPIRILIHQ